MIRIVIGSEIKLFRWRVNRTKFWKGSKWCLKKAYVFCVYLSSNSDNRFLMIYGEAIFIFNKLFKALFRRLTDCISFLWLVSNSRHKNFLLHFRNWIHISIWILFNIFFSDSKLVSMKINFISFSKFGKRCFWSRFKFMCWTLQQFSCLTSAFEDKCWTILKLMQKLS